MATTHLVTGVPSFLGERVVSSILEDPDARVICLVSEGTPPNEFRGFGDGRVECMEGRTASMHLGLSSAEYRRLRREVHFIHHLPRLDATPAEVEQGVENVLELAGECDSLERLVHVSPTRTRLPLSAARTFGRLRSRIEARVEAAMERLPLTVFRPQRVLGDSRTGEFEPGNIPVDLALRWAIPPFPVPLPGPGFDDLPFQAVPADWVARTALRLGRDASTRGKVVRLLDPDPVPVGWVWREVARRLGRRSPAPLRALLGLAALPGGLFRPWAEARQEGAAWTGDAERCPSLPTYLDRLLAWAAAQLSRRETLLPSTDPSV
ncbi:MAG TPA: SDR family oxidoreductase [Fredinandcohnia sp.]|nr:SDR family oxidoreductase [Fredinandcohnia sp.]